MKQLGPELATPWTAEFMGCAGTPTPAPFNSENMLFVFQLGIHTVLNLVFMCSVICYLYLWFAFRCLSFVSHVFRVTTMDHLGRVSVHIVILRAPVTVLRPTFDLFKHLFCVPSFSFFFPLLSCFYVRIFFLLQCPKFYSFPLLS